VSHLALEIGTEAVPAGYLPPALDALAAGARQGLGQLRLEVGDIRIRGTAQRLVLELVGLASRQSDLERVVQGPRVEAAYRDGVPTPAAEGFARKNGLSPADLEVVATGKGDFVQVRVHEEGRPAAAVLPDLLTRLVGELAWPKTMVWNETLYRFPRPIRWVLCLLDGDVLPLEVAGLRTGRITRGHRLLGPGWHEVKEAGKLDDVLREAGIVLDPARRRETIRKGLAEAARTLGGAVVSDDGLLEEVCFLTEHPRVFPGSFDRAFLELPREVVVTAMRSHQRYFAVEDTNGRLLPHFLVVCDGHWEDPSLVVAGNERVLRARLADARFYWQVDLKRGLDALTESLGQVVWLESLGSMRDKVERVTALVDWLGRTWHGESWTGLRDDALRAARISKADLASEMIKDGKEFTGLQGTIGARYAEAGGESAIVSGALIEQYLPRGAGDPVPASTVGEALAVADRLDTIAGCWAAGFVPSGSQDPYGLRRAGNGIVRILLEKKIHASLPEAVERAVAGLPEAVHRDDLVGGIRAFFEERLAHFLREHGIPYDVADAVLAADAEDPLDVLTRARALEHIRAEEDLERLVVGFKRAANILKGIDVETLPDPAGLDWKEAMPAERDLHEVTGRVEEGLDAAWATKDYPAMLELLLGLRGPIDVFFDDVLVMAEDPAERDRRLALLARARGLFHHVFDPARIVIEGEGAR
jgi:glycyl-tRNA synthetase beta chain